MATPRLTRFPLAENIVAKIADAAAELVDSGTGMFATDVTPVTAELLRYWFQRDYSALRPINFHDGQRDAILAIIYAHEVLQARNVMELYRTLAPGDLLDGDVLREVGSNRNNHPKYAAKMATGTGKTWVLNALLIWQHLNAVSTPEDRRFSSNFLIVAPGLIVYERLLDSFQGRLVEGHRVFETSDIFATRDLFVPDTYRQKVFGFLQSSAATKHEIGRRVTGSGVIAVTNWHLLTGQEDPEFLDESLDSDVVSFGEDLDVRDLVDDLLPLTPGIAAGNSLDVLDRRHRRGEQMQYLVDLPSLVVFNDEAHHIHSISKGGETSEVEWQKSLRQIAATKAERFIQVDFSATPFNEVGGRGAKSKRYFPHIVVDFDITDAMRRGLIKGLAIDKRREIASLPLDFVAERDSEGNITLSEGQRVMLRAGLEKLHILERDFAEVNPKKYPKMMVVCEDTAVVPLVEEFLRSTGLDESDILSVHSGKKAELGLKEWETVRERLFAVDSHAQPKVIVSVLMLREGFDVSNICVIVPLRATRASILLEQTIGRGLRLMWRGDAQVDEEKAENRALISKGLAPKSYLDMLFIVEHPEFQQFYDDLITGGLAAEIEDDATTRTNGEIERVGLRDGFERYDFEVPIILRDADEEMRAPTIDPLQIEGSAIPLEVLKKAVGEGDQFISHELQSGTQFGDYRVDGGVMTATGYNDMLSRLATRIAEAHGRAFVTTNQLYNKAAQYPLIQAYKPLLIGWLDRYIRNQLFGPGFDPLADENWRVLTIGNVAEGISGRFGALLVELQENVPLEGAEVSYRWLSEVDELFVRNTSAATVSKCIYERLPIPSRSGGLERAFIEWADRDGTVNAFTKIHEYKHDFLRRPYLKEDGMPAQYSPDFLVRTADRVYVVETKGDSSLSDENVKRKKRSAVAWVNRINALDANQRNGQTWHYVLASESSVKSWIEKGGTCSAYLESARLFEDALPENSRLF